MVIGSGREKRVRLLLIHASKPQFVKLTLYERTAIQYKLKRPIGNDLTCP
jgi:hypothetical protein